MIYVRVAKAASPFKVPFKVIFTFGRTFLNESRSQYLKIGTLLLSTPYDNESIKSEGLLTQNPVRTDFEISRDPGKTQIRQVSQGISNP